MIVITAVVAFVVGALIAGLAVVARSKSQLASVSTTAHQREADLAQHLATAESTAHRVPTLEEQLAKARTETNELGATVARLEQQVRDARQREVETNQLMATTKEEMGKEFKLLANQLFEEKGKQLNERQRETLSDLLKPFDTNLKDFKAKIDQSREADIEARANLFAQIGQLTTLNHELGDKAQSLTNALRGESKTRGIWGEQVLQKLLELAGLREGINFRTQASHHDAGSSARLIPDVVLDLPNERAIIIDSKVSLVAYERYGTADDDEAARAQALKEHCASLKRHIKDLSEKNYPKLYGLKSVDFTLLFVPIESALMVASQAEPDLTQYALERHVALVSPNTLFTVLRTIEYIWRVEKTTRNMDKIVFRGEQMYKATRRFAEFFVAINDNLKKASASAEDAEKALINPHNGLIRQAEQLRAFGVKADKPMPERLAGSDDEIANREQEDTTPGIADS